MRDSGYQCVEASFHSPLLLNRLQFRQGFYDHRMFLEHLVVFRIVWLCHGLSVSVNSFLDTFGPKIRLQQPRHNIAPVSPGRGLCSHAVQ